jgi:hypothetical protein
MNAWVYTAFVMFLLGHLWLFFRDRRMVLAKIASSIVFVGLIALLSSSFVTWLGWPAGKPTPGVKYTVIAVSIREPRPDRAGEIYVWLSTDTAQSALNPFVHSGQPGSPRAFEIPFTPETEKAMQRAAQALRKGQSVFAMFGEDAGAEGAGDAHGLPGQERGGGLRPDGRAGSAAPKLFIDEPGGSAIAKK